MYFSQIGERLLSISQELSAIAEQLQADSSDLEFPPEAADKVAARVCLECGKQIPQKKRVVRGCHESCYKRVMRRLKEEGIAEDAAIQAGILAPPGTAGRPRSVEGSAIHSLLLDRG